MAKIPSSMSCGGIPAEMPLCLKLDRVHLCFNTVAKIRWFSLRESEPCLTLRSPCFQCWPTTADCAVPFARVGETDCKAVPVCGVLKTDRRRILSYLNIDMFLLSLCSSCCVVVQWICSQIRPAQGCRFKDYTCTVCVRVCECLIVSVCVRMCTCVCVHAGLLSQVSHSLVSPGPWCSHCVRTHKHRSMHTKNRKKIVPNTRHGAPRAFRGR